ncbi:uncharacterized protein LOC120266375 [Dioscorea cayenensis subsp. rotundata]|uniref:Uncharacterized protein LOC120266375 n=1 Tax=Dioscorea cayennensis subsp. rotundata TaxID=55577 RepID=A0AB40BR87_DIOCR|nr:uncharacterized protein LOC120266375 [Dioscorea cayenensis subsp. rotundata]
MGEKMMTMKKKKTTTMRGRAWRLIRIALIWARKGGAFKQSLLLSLKLAFKNITNYHQKSIHYLEREFSFDETPSFRFKLHRPHFPCIGFPDDHDQDNDDAVFFFSGHDNNVNNSISYDHHKNDDDNGIKEEEQQEDNDDDEVEQLEGINSQAEEFIAKFYQEMKLQRQVSFIQYNDMLLRSIS